MLLSERGEQWLYWYLHKKAKNHFRSCISSAINQDAEPAVCGAELWGWQTHGQHRSAACPPLQLQGTM